MQKQLVDYKAMDLQGSEEGRFEREEMEGKSFNYTINLKVKISKIKYMCMLNNFH